MDGSLTKFASEHKFISIWIFSLYIIFALILFFSQTAWGF